jgi:putative transposase
MHNLPKAGNLHLIAALGHFAIEAVAAGVQALQDRKKHQELLDEYQRLNGLSDEAMAAYRPSLADLAEPGPPELRAPLRTRLTTPERDATYHLASRLAGDLPLLEDEERRVFRRMLKAVSDYCGVRVLNFTILDNHFHLLLRVPRRDTRKDLTPSEMLRRIRFLHPELAELLSSALFPENEAAEAECRKPGSALEHFGVRRMQGKAELLSPDDSARDWAQREVERHRKLMCELEMFIRILKQRFSKWYNATHDRFGTLWADRFRSMLLEEREEILQAVSAYIDLNAVRRGWVEDPTAYEHCGLAEAVKGGGAAREGISAIVGEENGDHVAQGSWLELLERHRSMLWGDLLAVGTAPAEVRPGKPRRYCEVPQRMVRNPVLADFFLLRHEVLLQGLALGSQRFLEAVFRSNRGAFGADGTWRGDSLILREGISTQWVVAGLHVLRNVRYALRFEDRPRRKPVGAFVS